MAERSPASNEVRMRSEIKAMLALAGLAAGCADRPAGGAVAARANQEAPRMEQRRTRRGPAGSAIVLELLDHF